MAGQTRRERGKSAASFAAPRAVSVPMNRNGAADSCFDAFSRGEPASTSLENALTAGRNCRGAPDHQGQWRRFSPGPRRTGQTAAFAAWLAGILADLGAGDIKAFGPFHADRAGSARLRRQRQAGRSLRAGRPCGRHADADGRARHRPIRRGRPRCRRRRDAAAGPAGARAAQRAVFLRLRLSRHRAAHGGA